MRDALKSFWSTASGIERVTAILLVLAALLEIAVIPTLTVNGYDGSFVLIWIKGWATAYERGNYYPRWLPDGFGGLGSPAFYFYPPLAYFASGAVHVLLPALSAIGIYHLVSLLATAISFITSRHMLRMIGSKQVPAILGAIVYTFAPFRFFDIYTRNGFAEHVGFAFVPLVFAGLFALRERLHLRAGLWMAAGWLAIILSNIPLLLVTSITGLLWAAALGGADWRYYARSGLFIVLGTASAAFYLLPILHFQPEIQLSNIWILNGAPRSPDYVHMLLTVMGNLTMGMHGVISDVVLLAVLITAWLTLKRSVTVLVRSLARATLLLTGFILAIQIPLIGDLLFEHTRIFSLIQFVWRFYIILLLLAGLWLSLRWREQDGRWMQGLGSFLGFAAIGTTIVIAGNLRVHARPPHWTPFDPPEYASIYAAADVNEVVRFGKAHAGEPKVITSRILEPVESIKQNDYSSDFSWRVTLDTPTAVTFHHWAWSEWKLSDSVNGRWTGIPVGHDSLGRLTATLPPGADYLLTLTLHRSEAEIAGLWISAGAALLALGLGLFLRKPEEGRRRNGNPISG